MKDDSGISGLNHESRRDQTGTPEYQSACYAEQIKLLYLQANKALLATLIIASILSLIFWRHISPSWNLSWLTAIFLLTLGRFNLIRSYFRADPTVEAAPLWGQRFIYGCLLSGILWGAAGSIFFVSGSVIHQLFLAFLLGGMLAGAMTTLSSNRTAFLVFSVPSTIPFVYHNMLLYDNEMSLVLGFTYLFFLLMITSISSQLRHNITESLNLRYENVALVHRLTQAKEQLELRVFERTEELAATNDILQQEKELFQITLASIGDAVITTDSTGLVTYLNPVAECFSGWKNTESTGKALHDIFQIRDLVQNDPIENILDRMVDNPSQSDNNQECILIHRDRHECIINYSIAPIKNRNKDIIGTVLTFRDVTEQRKLTEKLAYQAAHDALTGLLNREEFENRLSKILASIRKNDIHALLYLDLDQFKVINDSCGHGAGDELLRQVTALLHSKLRTRDTLARLGGDEFGIILEHCPPNEALQVANTLRELIQNFRYRWQDKTFTIGVSIGLFPIRHDNDGLASTLSAADSACFAAKDQGRNRVHVYHSDDTVLQQRSSEMQWLPRIQDAIINQRLCLFFQPIVAVQEKNELIEHGEFLLRLQGEHDQLIYPASFLPSAERYDQMLAIDQWVIDQSLKLLSTRSFASTKKMYAIYLSAQALGNEEFLTYVIEKMQFYGCQPSTLCFEITENIALADLQHVTKFITTLKALGCHFSMDDFGSGLSSFGYLKNIPLDYLKIDGKLVKGMCTDPVDRAMVEAINRIGHVMGMKTIAEWVEDAPTLDLLRAMGVDYVQGNELAQPYPFTTHSEAVLQATLT